MSSLFSRIAAAFRRRRLAADLDDEIRAHYDELRQALEDDGHPPADAARLARLRLGGALQIRESSQDEWRVAPFDGLAQDMGLALRSLARRPGFAIAAIATLALGIGASTAIFSVTYGVALRPLPYPAPDRLVRLYEANPGRGQFGHHVSDGAFDEWRRGVPAIQSAALFSPPRLRSVAGRDRLRLVTMSVSPAFFDVIGIRPLLGSGFKPESAYTRFTTTDVIVSHRTWQRLFDGRRDVIGRTLTFAGAGDDDVFHVVGVMPKEFEFLEPVDAWFPEIVEQPLAMRLLNLRYGRAIARLAEGATIDRARTELESIAARLARDYPASAGWTATVETLHASIVGQFARATWLLLAAVGVVLLIACLNVGGLLTARAIARARETAVRVSLGAGRWRLLRLWLAEAALLSLAGAAAGMLIAAVAVRALKSAAPPGIPRIDAIAMDGPTIVVALAATALSTVLFAVAPIGRARRGNLTSELRMGSAPAGDRRERRAIQTAITVAQCAGAAALVMLAVLLTRSFIRLSSFELGWRPTRVLSAAAEPRMPRDLRRPWFARVEWADRIVERLEAAAGIDRAAVTTQLPLGPAPYTSTIARGRGRGRAAAAPDDGRWTAILHKVTDGYFDVMDIRLESGRRFAREDRFTEAQMTSSEARPPNGVAIVTAETARTLWPGASPIGQAVWLADNTDNVQWREVIGIVENIQFGAVGERPALHIFLPWTQDSASSRVYIVAAGEAADPSAAVVRQIVESTAPGAAVDATTPLEALVAQATAQPRFTSRVVSAFGALALVLAAVGIYGTLAYLVGTRTREIGVRLALGAPRHGIVADVIGRGLRPVAVGGLLGLLLALILAQSFRALLFELAPADPASIATGAAALLIVAAVAAGGPAIRAARVDPVRALRAE